MLILLLQTLLFLQFYVVDLLETFLYDLILSCLDKLYGFLWALLVQADIIDAFNTTSRYLDAIVNINNVLTIW